MTVPPAGAILRYAFPLACLVTVPVSFFAAGRHRGGWRAIPAAGALRAAAALPLAVSGVGHLLATGIYASIIPPAFPHRPALVVLSGVLELAGAAGLWLPTMRRPAALCLVLLMLAVFPANIYAAGRSVHGIPMPGVPLRTAMQAAYILLLLAAGWGWPAAQER